MRRKKLTDLPNKTKEPQKSEQSFSKNQVKELFNGCADVEFQTHMYGRKKQEVLYVKCEGMVDSQQFSKLVSDTMSSFFQKEDNRELSPELLKEELYLPSLKEVTKPELLIADVFSGKVILYFEGYPFLISIDLAKLPQRKPEETNTEVTIKGPRDDFIEDITVNIALVRKRLRTNSLRIKKFEVGKRSLTNVALLYIDDITNKDIVNGISEKINNIDVDAIYSGNQLMEMIEKKTQIFPRHDYTGRPDFVLQCLLQGRAVLMIDGVSYAIITPANLFLLFKTSEDAEYSSIYTSFERLMRVAGIIFAALLPAFWVAITTFHQNQMPLVLLATVVEARKGLPLPSALEAVLMLLLFELFREAGMRLPNAIGNTLSVVGGLIIGDAAIRAGLTSPAMIVVIALSTIATFTLVNQSLVGTISLLRLFAILFVSIFGLFGFFVSIFFALVYLCNIRTFGLPYIELAADLSIKNILKAVIRIPKQHMNQRPEMLNTIDNTKQEKE